jgi:Tol biopolymer transport system component
VPNTEGANFPFWSADGRSLGFFADGKLKRVDLAGGPVQTLCDAPSGRGGTWNKNGDILFTPSGLLGIGLYRIAASGGTPSQILAPDHKLNEDSVRWASFLPDGVHFIYSGVNLTGKEDLYAIYEGALNSTEKHLLVRSRGNAMYAEPGILVFYKDRTLFAQDFDWRRGELRGESRPIYSNVDFSPRIAKGSYSVSGSGLLLAQKAGEAGSSQLVWFDRKGHELGVVAKQGIYGNVTLSRDGKFVASDAMDINNLNTDIYTFDVESGESKRVTFDPAIDSLPAWSPDGKQVVFANNGQSRFDLYLKNVDGSQAERQIAQDGPDRFPVDWSRDGKYILYERGSDLWYLRTADMTAKELLKAPSTIRSSQFSPDGKWVAYSSNETGKWEVFVTSFPDGHGKWQISNAGGNQPRWRGDSREMYYMTPDSKLVAVPVKSGSSFEAGAATVLFQAYPREAAFATSEQYFYDVSKDGQKFLINAQIRSAMAPLSVVHGWNLELKK